MIRLRNRDERGNATIFVLGMSIVLLLCAGLVVDGGLGINARMRVADDAEQAARVGANSIDIDTLRTSGVLTIDPVAAQLNAANFLASKGYSASQIELSVNGDRISVRLHDTSDTEILTLIGIDSYPVSARATAVAATG